MLRQRNHYAFTLLETLVVIAILLIATAIALPTFAYFSKQARLTANLTQLRGIHQGLVIWGQSSKRPPPEGYPMTGLDTAGKIKPHGSGTGFSGAGDHPAARYWLLLAGNFFTPEYIISPADSEATEVGYDPVTRDPLTVSSNQYSYAMLSLRGTANERAEWRSTLHPHAIVLSDRAIGTGSADASSDWTELGSGDWRGHAVYNDNRSTWLDSPTTSGTRYGTGLPNATDDLFEDDPTADDALLVHDDAATAYSNQ